MPFQILLKREENFAVGTLKWFLPCVAANVTFHVIGMVGCILARKADELVRLGGTRSTLTVLGVNKERVGQKRQMFRAVDAYDVWKKDPGRLLLLEISKMERHLVSTRHCFLFFWLEPKIRSG